MKKIIFALVLILSNPLTGICQGYELGDLVADFSLKSTTGKNVSLSNLNGNKGAIVIFTCNNCPFSIAYEDRIIALNDKFSTAGYPVVAINPNDANKVPEDSYRNMIKKAKSKIGRAHV